MSMSRRTLRMFLGALAAAALTIFGVPANAVVYGSGFDPVTFSGTGFFEFDNHCETDNGGFGTYTQAQCNVLFLSAPVDMTHTNTGGPGQLDFRASPAIFDYLNH